MPDYIKAAGILKEKDLYIAKFEVTPETKSNRRYGVVTLPKLKMFRYGVISDYNGSRLGENIASFVIEKSKPPSKPISCTGLTNLATGKHSIGQDRNLVFFGVSEGPEWEIYDSITKQGTIGSYAFFHTGAECAV